MSSRLLIITHEKMGQKMAGPAIRTQEIAKALSRQGITVTVSFPFPFHEEIQGINFESFHWEDPSSIENLINCHEVLFATGPVLARILQVIGHSINIPVVVDLYDVVEIEKILVDVYSERKQVDPLAAYLSEMFLYLRQGDFFVCGSERQIDFWLGCLLAVGRINHQNLPILDSISSIICVVPMGIPMIDPSHQEKRIKGVIDGISETDKIVFWSGGIWDWSDPLSLLEAFEIVLSSRSDVKLVFGSLHHYDTSIVPKTSMAERFLHYIKEKSWIGKKVHFLDWVPYEIRSDFLLESDLGVSLFLNPLESRYAVRSRLMDHLWTGLPTISTYGDEISDLLASLGLARLVEIRDVNAIAEAMLNYLEKPFEREKWLKNNRDVINKYRWDNTVEPIINFLKNPGKAQDKPAIQHSLNYVIPLRREWERLIHDRELLQEEVIMLRQRKVVRIADFYGKIRNKILGK